MSARINGISTRRLLFVAGAALIAAPFVPVSARAASFGPVELISKSSREQAEIATEPAISADGRYAAFCAELGGREGVLREQLETGQVERVAIGPIDFSLCGTNGGAPYAGAPSISADGRYISFSTAAALVEEDEDATTDVYVADMSTTPITYELVSSVDESDQPLEGASVVAGRVALSADGDRVAFVNGGNVYVRELVAKKTVLISAVRESGGGMTREPVSGGGGYELAAAAISADGSTVAWVGEHLPQQVPLREDEEAAIKKLETSGGAGLHDQYHEPLWRRIPSLAGATPPTRRVVGCSVQEIPCQGPFTEAPFNNGRLQTVYEENGFGWGVRLPQLDADGGKVAFVGDPDEQYDLFVVDMQEGLNRLQAVHQITQWINPAPKATPLEQVLLEQVHPEYLPFTGAVATCAISPDGTRVAFATSRQHFATAPYTLITELPSAVGRMAELYELNLDSNKFERATPGPGKDISTFPGNTLQKGVGSISFGAGDRLLGFSSGADNLVTGDANDMSDAFVIESLPPAPIGATTISSRPPQFVVKPAWRMTVNAYSRPDGSIRVVARVPGQGTLRASARAQLGGRLKSRRVSAGRRGAKAAGAMIVDLKLGRGRRPLARRPGLIARVHVTFTGEGGRPLHDDLQSRFLIHRKRVGAANRRRGTGR